LKPSGSRVTDLRLACQEITSCSRCWRRQDRHSGLGDQRSYNHRITDARASSGRASFEPCFVRRTAGPRWHGRANDRNSSVEIRGVVWLIGWVLGFRSWVICLLVYCFFLFAVEWVHWLALLCRLHMVGSTWFASQAVGTTWLAPTGCTPSGSHWLHHTGWLTDWLSGRLTGWLSAWLHGVFRGLLPGVCSQVGSLGIGWVSRYVHGRVTG
jgi:hypothetical protein